MVGYEQTYCKLLTGEYSGSDSLVDIAYRYVNNQLKVHESILEKVYLVEVDKDYKEYLKAIKEYEQKKIHMHSKHCLRNK